jgi:hypothetical protein
MTTKVGRNDPCPCGSGKKYKNCHEGRQGLGSLRARGPWLWIPVAVVALAATAFAVLRPKTPATLRPFNNTTTTTTTATTSASTPLTPSNGTAPAPIATTTSPTASATAPASGTPQAWQYDPATNRHWDPNHGHWHDGPAPPESQRGSSAPTTTMTPAPGPTSAQGTPTGATPAPWTYDAATNQHWDPNHGHWHSGPPPTNR